MLVGQKDFDIDKAEHLNKHFLALVAMGNDNLTKFSCKLHLPLYAEFYHNRCFVVGCDNVPHPLLKVGEHQFFCRSHFLNWTEAVGNAAAFLTVACHPDILQLWEPKDANIRKNLITVLCCMKQRSISWGDRHLILFLPTRALIRECISERETKEMNEWILQKASKHSDDQGKLDRDKLKNSINNKKEYPLSHLQQQARARGLNDSGTKMDIIERIVASMHHIINRVVEAKREKRKTNGDRGKKRKK